VKKKLTKGKIIKRILLGILAAFVLFVAIVFTVNKIKLAQEFTMLKEAGYYNPVSVGDYSLNVYISGNQDGKHRFVELAGGGVTNYSLHLDPVLERFKDENQIILVDRAGYGLSDDNKNTQTVEQIVNDYRTALQNAGIKAPYLLLPHSIGGVYATYWVSEYPDEIEGIIFFEGTQLCADFTTDEITSHSKNMINKLLCDLGFFRLASKNYIFPLPGERTAEEQSISYALSIRSGVKLASSSEEEMFVENSRFSFNHIKTNDVPKVYICGGTGFSTEEEVLNHVKWMNIQRVNKGMKEINYDRSLIPVTIEKSKEVRESTIIPYVEKMGNCEMVLLAGDHFIFDQRPEECTGIIEEFLGKLDKN